MVANRLARSLLVLSSVSVLPVAASAQPINAQPGVPDGRSGIPAFDIASRCDQNSRTPNCVESEHAALNALHFWWSRIGDAEKAFCLAKTQHDPSLNYSHLMGCIARRAHLPPPVLASADTVRSAASS